MVGGVVLDLEACKGHKRDLYIFLPIWVSSKDRISTFISIALEMGDVGSSFVGNAERIEKRAPCLSFVATYVSCKAASSSQLC